MKLVSFTILVVECKKKKKIFGGLENYYKIFKDTSVDFIHTDRLSKLFCKDKNLENAITLLQHFFAKAQNGVAKLRWV